MLWNRTRLTTADQVVYDSSNGAIFNDLEYLRKCAADAKLFSSMCKVHHCINYLLPEVKTSDYSLRKRDYHYELPSWHYSLFRNSFVIRCLFKFKWTVVMSFCPFFCMYVCYMLINIHTYIHTYIHTFQGHTIIWRWKCARYRHSFTGILLKRVISNDLE